MCTVLFAYKTIPGWPLVVANNRDEFFQRRALPPRIYTSDQNQGLRWLASCDLTSGGSWWGYNSYGLLVWLTNRWTGSEYEEGLRSRGELVTNLLNCADPEGARAQLEDSCDGLTFNPFNLIIATRESAFFVTNFPSLYFTPLLSGFHYLGNGQLDGCTSVKARSARRLFDGISKEQSRDDLLAIFRRALRTHLPQDSIPPQGFNVKFDDYGTTSSLTLALADTDRAGLQLQYCDANPLSGSYYDYSSLGCLL